MPSFTAIDFETATSHYTSACAVGIVTIERGKIIEEFYSLIQPPGNLYQWQNVRVHGITPQQTKDLPTFEGLYPEIRKRLIGRVMVAHNESFDRNVLKKTMDYYRLNYHELNLTEMWECTCKIYKAKGFRPVKLNACCERMGISLNHHEALSDARAAAQLYLMK